MHRIFIGSDPRQVVSLTTLVHSIAANAKEPVAITPLVLETLPLKRQGLTPFTWSRFLVPYLCGYKGWALFCDADQLVLGDISELFKMADQSKAVHVMQEQPLFEWASLILFNCEHPANRILTPEHIENPETKNLHKIGWLHVDQIGRLPLEWNVCVPYAYPGKEPPANAKLVHFTQGVPQWFETEDQPYANAWKNYRDAAGTATHTWYDLMGRSVHAESVLTRLVKTGKVKDLKEYAERIGYKAEAAE